MVEVIKAEWKDCRKLYELASKEDIRSASFHPEKIEYQTHEKWFEKILESENEIIYILLINEVFAGQLRFSLISDYCTIGISLNEKARGKNNAVFLFNKAYVELRKKNKNIKQIKAFIKNENIRSQKYFKKIGFNFYKKTKINNFDAQEWVFDIGKVFIVAELSANHNHDIQLAKKSIEEIKNTGADAVKIQTYTADTITIDCDNEYFQIKQGTLWDGRNLYDLYKEAYTPWEWHKELKEYAESIGLVFFSSPFDFTAVDFLEELDVPIFKIASFEITDLPLIEYTAAKGKPMIISTGIATINEIQLAVDICRKVGNNDITLLQCTSSYPTPIENANLSMIPSLSKTFNVKAGLSDHTIGSVAAVAAVALGACMVEKHFIFDRSKGGPDAEFSMEPIEFKKMVDDIRTVEKALGKVDYSMTGEKIKSRKFSRSLFVVKNVKKGEPFTNDNLRSIRPGNGIAPKYINDLIGKRARYNISAGTPMTWECVD